MVEPPIEAVAFVDRQIKLEFVARARRRIRPDRVLDDRAGGTDAVADVGFTLPFRQHTHAALEKPRKLGQDYRPLIVEAARRMAFTQEFRPRRDLLGMRGRELAQIDLLSG